MNTPQPLRPSDPRLRSGRYEVAAYGPKDPATTRRLRLAGPSRFMNAPTARRHAEAIAADNDYDLVEIVRIAPRNPRYPDGPWAETFVAAYGPGARTHTELGDYGRAMAAGRPGVGRLFRDLRAAERSATAYRNLTNRLTDWDGLAVDDATATLAREEAARLAAIADEMEADADERRAAILAAGISARAYEAWLEANP